MKSERGRTKASTARMIYDNWIFRAVAIVAALAVSCIAQDGDWQYAKLTFPVGNDDPAEFGYMGPDRTGPGIGPKSIILNSGYAYVTDEVHGNVKRIDLITGHVKVSPVLRERPRVAWPRDIAVLDSLVYVTSNRDCIYVLDVDVEHLYTLPLPRGNEPYFIEIGNDSLLVYQQVGHHLTLVYSPDSLVSLRDTSLIFSFDRTPHGKGFTLNQDSTSLETDRYALSLKSRFTGASDGLDAINIDFNDSTLVYFDVNEKEFVLHVYRRGW